MEDLVQLYQPVPQSIPSNNQLEIDDQQGQDLFNQIQLDELSFQNKQQSDQMKFPVATAQDIQQNTKKLKKALQLDSDEQQNKQTIMKTPRDKQKHKYSKSDRKRSKKQKKLRKKLKKQKQQSKNNFKRLKKQGETDKKSESDKWSGENQQSDSEDSGASSDSLLQGLNPTKIKNGKVRSTQKKQGFSLKQLGNDGQVDYEQDNVSGDSQFKDRKNKKTIKARAEKKQVTNNQQVLKSLFQLGLCVQQENYEHKTKQDDGYDNGLQQIEKLKGSKKKGPKIANKLFADLQINQEEEQSNKLMHNKIQLEIKPRINNGLSHLALSFLAKTEKIKKVRGMESQMQNEEYQKMISMKAKQSMKKLISQKEVEQAEDIQLDVKVPEVIKGSGEINNSIFLKKISSTISHKQANEVKPATPVKQIVKQIKPQQKTKLSRVQFFKSITEDVKARRSKQFCDELIKNNFKITNLDEIEQLRKKNEEKKKRQILAGSEQEEEEESEKQQNHKDEDVVFQNKLGFMNFAIEVQDAGFQKQSQPEVQANGNKIQSEQNAINNEKVQNKNDKNKKVEQVSAADKVHEVKKFSIQLNDSIPDKEYRKLLQLEQGQEIQQNENMEDAMQNQQQLIDNQIDMQNQSEFAPIRNLNQQLSEDSHNQISEKQIQQAEAVDLQVDLQVSKINNQQEQQLLNSSSENIQAKDKGKEQPINQQYQLYLNELEAEGINLKKTYNKSNKIRNDKKIDINQYLIESKQNDQIRENGGQEKPQIEESQARKQFRKLRKLAVILKNKKIHEQKIKKAQQFFDEEAEEGSDDQNHDNLIKQIDYDQEAKEFQGMDLDADLVELIDDVDIDEEEDIAFRKFMEDQKIRDIEEIKRIMKGDFKRRRDVQPLIDQIDEDEKNRIQRMEEYKQYLQRMQKQQGKDLYMKDDNEDNDDKGDQSQGENEKGNSNKDNKKAGNVQQDMEMIDEINEQNLKKYFDECAGQTFKSKVTNVRPIVQLPASYQRQKKTVMRNTIKVKQQNEGMKLKKTTSHLNEQIMKNKEKIKPLIMLKPFGLIGPNKKK